MTELAVDPRAFDFDHPINQRPNHHFGQWDDDTISLDGYFERFIFHAVTLEALLGSRRSLRCRRRSLRCLEKKPCWKPRRHWPAQC